MAESDTGRRRPSAEAVQTLGCTPRSGVPPVSQPPETFDFEEKLLDEGELRHHLGRLESTGAPLEISIKENPQSAARASSLEGLIAPLVQNEVFGAQIQYSLGGHQWLDTLISTSNGVRLVRLQLTA